MERCSRYRLILVLLGLGMGSATLFGYAEGPPGRRTPAPGDNPAVCTSCHGGTPLNGGGGSVEIHLAGTTYTPGVKQTVSVVVSDPAQKRWGFEFSARLNSDLANGQAGDLAPSDAFTQVICDGGGPAPCSSSSVVQFIEHTVAGTRAGTPGPTTFQFDWTPPPAGSGPVTLYVSGNAANGDFNLTGDHIYTNSLVVTETTSTAIAQAILGTTNAASFDANNISGSTWVSLFGSNLSSTTRSWTGTEIVNGVLPTTLDGVSVTVNGKAAAVSFISPGQVNILSPDDTTEGPVPVAVTTAAGTTTSTVTLKHLGTAFFLFGSKHLAANHVDGSPVGAPGLLGSGVTSTPAKPGEIITLWGTGFGPTDPLMPSSQLVTAVAKLVKPVTITIGGTPADVQFAGLIPGFAGLYQFNVVVPTTATTGDQAVVAQIDGVTSESSSACCFVTVQQ